MSKSVDKSVISDALSSGDDSAITLIALLASWYGDADTDGDGVFDFAEVDPLTLSTTLQQDFGTVSERSFAKLNAAFALIAHHDLFFNSVGYFISIVAGLNGNEPRPQGAVHRVECPDSDDLLLATMEAMLLLGGDYDTKYKPEICRFVGEVLAHDGYRLAPDMLSFADYGKDDESRALSRSERDGNLSAAISRQALMNRNDLEIWLALRLSGMLDRWVAIGLSKDGDEWVTAISDAVHKRLDGITADLDKVGGEL